MSSQPDSTHTLSGLPTPPQVSVSDAALEPNELEISLPAEYGPEADSVATQDAVEFCAPPDEVLEEYARQVCDSLAEQDPSYTDHEITAGFAEFLKVVARATANYLNEEAATSLVGRSRPS
jgi:hypothetical protein